MPVRLVLDRRCFWVALVCLIFPYYALLLMPEGQLKLEGQGLGLTFNSMLEHLLSGRFDVAPGIVGDEGFERDGLTYAYWGIFPALLRLPLLLVPNGLSLNVTALSCLIAVCLAVTVKLLTLREAAGAGPRIAAWLVTLLGLAIVFSGPQITFLKASLYQEVCLWAGALAALFVYCAVRCVVRGSFDCASLCGMAAAAGLALHTRVSMAIGLYAALGLLMMLLAARACAMAHASQSSARPHWDWTRIRNLPFKDLLPPLVILLAFAGIAALINQYRWGHPLVFADYDIYQVNQSFPDRLSRTEAYGLFNLVRLPLGILYYFVPLWVVRRPDGHLLFEEQQTRLLDAAELPPSSFLLTDALLVLLLALACWAIAAPRYRLVGNRPEVAAIGAGLALPWLLMLSAISMNFRYRIEFYPLLEFGAFVAVASAVRGSLALSPNARSFLFAGMVLSVVGSHLVLILYKLSPFGPATGLLRPGIVHFYAAQFAERAPSLRWILPGM